MRTALIILPFVAMVACATPREQCIAGATRDTRVLSSLIQETRGNLARGYALEEQQDVRTVTRVCRRENADGSTFSFPCNDVQTVTRTVPVAIDLTAEQAKLVSLEQRFAQSQEAANQAVLQCIAAYPE